MDSIKIQNTGLAPVKYSLSKNVRYKSVKSPNATDIFVRNSCSKSPFDKGFDGILCRVSPNSYINKYVNECTISNALKNNPKIKIILSSKGLDGKIYINNIAGQNTKHFLTTYDAAKKMSKNLLYDDNTILLQASLLHDIGKGFIPEEILNKPGKLSDEERQIVDLHAALGAEILKSAGLDLKLTEAVRLHHTSYKDSSKQNNEIAQILSAADVYSALREKRSYKEGFDDKKTMQIMQADEKLNPKIIKMLF